MTPGELAAWFEKLGIVRWDTHPPDAGEIRFSNAAGEVVATGSYRVILSFEPAGRYTMAWSIHAYEGQAIPVVGKRSEAECAVVEPASRADAATRAWEVALAEHATFAYPCDHVYVAVHGFHIVDERLAPPILYEVGLAGLLADPGDERPGGFYRDEILAHISDELSTMVDLEVREVLSADLPMASGGDDDVGDLLVMAAPGVGGPLAPAAAAPVLAELARLGPRGTLPGRLWSIVGAPRAVLVPPWVPPRGVFSFRPPHPLAGVAWLNLVAVTHAVREQAGDDPAAAHFLELMAFCAKEKLVASWRRAFGG